MYPGSCGVWSNGGVRSSRSGARPLAPGARSSERMACAWRCGIAGARDHAPALGDRVDPALVASRSSRAACRRRSRHGGTTRRPSRASRPPPRTRRPGARSSPATARSPRGLRVHREGAERGDQEPRQPDALAPAFDARRGSSRRSSRRCPSAAGRARPRCRRVERAQAVLVDAAVLVGHLGQIVDLVLVRLERAHREERHVLVEHRGVAGERT